MHAKNFSICSTCTPRVQLVGVLRIHMYNTQENMHTNQLESEARTCIRT